MKHTRKTDARIRRAYEKGERLADVALEMGCTRDVIIGRARRLGLAVAGRSAQGVRHPKVRASISRGLTAHFQSPEGDIHREAVAAGVKRWWRALSDQEKADHVARMIRARTRKTVHRSGAWNGYALAPAETQDGDHVVSVGVHVQRMGRLAILLTPPLNWPGRFANRRSGLFHSQFARRVSSTGCCNRRRAGAHPLSYRLVATFNSCAALLIGRSHQFNRISDKPGSDLAYPFHSFNASLVRYATRHRTGEDESCSQNPVMRFIQ